MSTHKKMVEEGGRKQPPRGVVYQQIMNLGGTTQLQEQNNAKFLKLLPMAQNGICSLVTLKSSLIILSILDIILGVFYGFVVYVEIFVEFRYFFANGPHYILTVYSFLRVFTAIFGVIGFVSVQRQNEGCA